MVTCIHPWADIWINARGLVSCCPQNGTFLGSLNEEDFESIWNNRTMQKVRRLVSQGRYKEAGCDRECPFLRGTFSSPDSLPPIDELINPLFSAADDASIYSENHKQTFKDFNDKKSTVSGFPLFVDIQPLLRCNANCIMCGQPHRSTLEHSQRLVARIERLQPYANFFRWQGGEVFLDKQFVNYLDRFNEKAYPHLRRYVITNGTVLSKEDIVTLTSGSSPVFFLVSIDGATPETYKKIRKGLNFNKAMATLDELATIQKQRKARATIVRWNYVVMRSTLADMPLALQKAATLGIDLNFAPLQGPYPEENIFRYQKTDDNFLDYFKELEHLSHNSRITVSGFTGIYARLKNVQRQNKP